MISEEEERRRFELMRLGLGPKEIGDRLGCSATAISKWMVRRGYKSPVRRGRKRKDATGWEVREKAEIERQKRERAENMRRFTEDDRAAKEPRLSYGTWRARQRMLAGETGGGTQSHAKQQYT